MLVARARFFARVGVAAASLLAACARSHPTQPPPAADRAPAPSALAATEEVDAPDPATLRAWLGEGRFAIRPGEHAPVRGSTHALVRIVAFQDFGSPDASAMARLYDDALQRWPDGVQVVLVHAPSRQNDMARPIAELTIAAGAQGKFWEAHDRVLRSPPANRAAIVPIVEELGLAIDDVKAAMGDGRHRAWIDADLETARAHGVARGPAVFVNGMPGPRDAAAFAALVERELALATKMVEAGVPRARLQSEMVALLPAPPPAPDPGDEKDDPRVNWAVPAGDAPMLGPANALVTVIVFAEFQCPFCGRVQPVLAELRKRHPEDLRIVFRHLPLAFHKHARTAAKAAVAADRQGKFWRMHDFLFGLKGEPDERAVALAAKRLKLDKRRFERDRTSPSVEAVITEDERIAKMFGVNGTPSFFINGRRLVGAQPIESFETVVAEELAKARKFAEGDDDRTGTLYERMIRDFAVPPE
jgi:protein-disulfide isomerase